MNEPTKAPESIYLQYDSDDCTWCVDQVCDDDVKYIRADLVAADRDRLKSLDAQPVPRVACPRCHGDGPHAECKLCEGTGYATAQSTPRTDEFELEHRSVDAHTAAYVAFELARTLERELAAIKSQPVPVEPKTYVIGGDNEDWFEYIDALQSYAKRLAVENAHLMDMASQADVACIGLRERAEKAEKKLAELEKEIERSK